MIGSSPYRISRGRVTAWPFTDDEATLHCGQCAARRSAVTTSTTRLRSVPLVTAVTSSPSNPNNNDVGSAMPLVLLQEF
ncbi:Uncharacterised protein [Mycobacteroides abscessus subsp. abscessus]|nr:Uncharacterised protein [Mycobacteroides abscessus subsp. abscessus]